MADYNEVITNIVRDTALWRTFVGERKAGLTHAYLLISEDTDWVEQWLLNLQCLVYCPTACLQCAECQKVLNGCKMDVMQPNPDGRSLKIDEMHAVLEDATMGSYEGGSKVYVLRNMNTQSERCQNALLKTLEEPNPEVYFVLTATSTAGVLPTILSRVRTIQLPNVQPDKVQSVLQSEGAEGAEILARCAQGNITLARTLAHDEGYFGLVDEVMDMLLTMGRSSEVLQYIVRPMFDKENIAKTLDVLQTVFEDVLYYQAGLPHALTYQHKLAAYQQLAPAYAERALPPIMQSIELAKQKVKAYCTPINVADDLLLKVLEVKSKCARS